MTLDSRGSGEIEHRIAIDQTINQFIKLIWVKHKPPYFSMM